MAKLPFTSVEHTTYSPFEIIHSDIWALSRVFSNLAFKYFILLVSNFSRYT